MARARTSLTVLVSTALVAGLGLLAAPTASAGGTFQDLIDASTAKAVASGGATYVCDRTTIRYSPDLRRYAVWQGRFLGIFSRTMDWTPAVIHPVNALDLAYQRTVGRLAAAHAGLVGAPRWYAAVPIPATDDYGYEAAFPLTVSGGQNPAWDTVSQVDGTHWLRSSSMPGNGPGILLTTSDGVIVSIGSPDAASTTPACTVTYGPSGAPALTGLRVGVSHVVATGLDTDLTDAVHRLALLRSRAGLVLSTTRSSHPLVVAARAMLAQLRGGASTAWTGYRVSAPWGRYVITFTAPAGHATLTWTLSRVNFLHHHPYRAAVVLRVGTAFTITPATSLG